MFHSISQKSKQLQKLASTTKEMITDFTEQSWMLCSHKHATVRKVEVDFCLNCFLSVCRKGACQRMRKISQVQRITQIQSFTLNISENEKLVMCFFYFLKIIFTLAIEV